MKSRYSKKRFSRKNYKRKSRKLNKQRGGMNTPNAGMGAKARVNAFGNSPPLNKNYTSNLMKQTKKAVAQGFKNTKKGFKNNRKQIKNNEKTLRIVGEKKTKYEQDIYDKNESFKKKLTDLLTSQVKINKSKWGSGGDEYYEFNQNMVIRLKRDNAESELEITVFDPKDVHVLPEKALTIENPDPEPDEPNEPVAKLINPGLEDGMRKLNKYRKTGMMFKTEYVPEKSSFVSEVAKAQGSLQAAARRQANKAEFLKRLQNQQRPFQNQPAPPGYTNTTGAAP